METFQHRESAMVSQDRFNLNVYLCPAEMLIQQMRVAPTASLSRFPSRTNGQTRLATRQAIDATFETGGAEARILYKMMELFPFIMPTDDIVQSSREQNVWKDARAKRRKIMKTDKLIQKRRGLYCASLLDVLLSLEDLANAAKDFNQNQWALQYAMSKIYAEVTDMVDGKGDDLTKAKPYIATLMDYPDPDAISTLLNCTMLEYPH